MRPASLARRVGTALTLALGLISPGLASASDSEALALAKQNFERYVQAFNQHDIPALMTLYADDVEAVVLSGESLMDMEYMKIEGRANLCNAYQAFMDLCPKSELKVNVASALFITPDVLVTEVSITISNLPPDLLPMKGQNLHVWKKIGDDWKIVRSRLLQFVPEPD